MDTAKRWWSQPVSFGTAIAEAVWTAVIVWLVYGATEHWGIAIVAGVGSAAVGLWLAVLGARGRGNSATRAPADTTRERS